MCLVRWASLWDTSISTVWAFSFREFTQMFHMIRMGANRHSYEITAAGLVIEYWGQVVNIGVWITVMIIVIVLLNALPVKFYGETEFWFAATKVIMMVGLLMVSFILFWGGGPSRDRLGFRYWNNPGAANEYLETGNTGRFLALIRCFVLSAFPFTFAPELLGMSKQEQFEMSC